MSLTIGNIVTVILEDCMYFEKQGEIVEIKEDGDSDGNIGVKFGKECRYLFGHLYGDHVIVRFLEAELRQDVDWNLKVKIERLYSNLWHTVYTLKEPFNPKSECKAERCLETAVRRCLINIWGTVYEIDLCTVCAKKYDGMCGEIFPHKPLVQVA